MFLMMLSFTPRQQIRISHYIQREQLPIYKWRRNFLYCVEKYRVTIVVGETGSGKSTQLPQYLYEAGWLSPDLRASVIAGEPSVNANQMVVTQPRRIAAVSLARKVAEEQNCPIGTRVGYQVRFEAASDPQRTAITFMTDGMLVQELMRDPLLRRFRVVMLDETHERSLNTDLLLGLLVKVMRRRMHDFRIIISSATLDVESFRKHFTDNLKGVVSASEGPENDATLLGDCVVMSVEGRQWPVQIHFAKDAFPDYVKAAARLCERLAEQHSRHGGNRRPTESAERGGSVGNILVFLTGQQDIEQCSELLSEAGKLERLRWKIIPLHSALPAKLQMRALAPLNHPSSAHPHSKDPHRGGERLQQQQQQHHRRVILATNIAEASLSVPGVTHVIDCGLVKLPVFCASSMLTRLLTVPISHSSAEQRAGRAGRCAPGQVFRLYSREFYDTQMRQFSTPEMLRTDLSQFLLQMKTLGVDRIPRFPFVSKPPLSHLCRALELCCALTAIDRHTGKLTDPLGAQMADFPLHPMGTAALLASARPEHDEDGCSVEMTALLALAQMPDIFVSGAATSQKRNEKAWAKFRAVEGDLISRLNALLAYDRHLQHVSRHFAASKSGRAGGPSDGSIDSAIESAMRSWCDQHRLSRVGLARAARIRDQLRHLVRHRLRLPWTSCRGSVRPLLRALTRGYFVQAAKLVPHSNEYRLLRGGSGGGRTADYDGENDDDAGAGGGGMSLGSNSVLYSLPHWPQYVLFTSLVLVAPGGKDVMEGVTAVPDPNWFTELAGLYYQRGTERQLLERAMTDLRHPHARDSK